jgi:hypothetical protein
MIDKSPVIPPSAEAAANAPEVDTHQHVPFIDVATFWSMVSRNAKTSPNKFFFLVGDSDDLNRSVHQLYHQALQITSIIPETSQAIAGLAFDFIQGGERFLV